MYTFPSSGLFYFWVMTKVTAEETNRVLIELAFFDYKVAIQVYGRPVGLGVVVWRSVIPERSDH